MITRDNFFGQLYIRNFIPNQLALFIQTQIFEQKFTHLIRKV